MDKFYIFAAAMMFHIQDTILSLDIIEKEFCCDLECCRGCCCIEGDAGAPVSESEEVIIRDLLPQLLPLMDKESRRMVEENGITYTDPQGERVTQIVGGRDCVFAHTNKDGWCYCLIEKLYREGKTDFMKPISCHLYPIRLKEYKDFTALEYHRWDICHSARRKGKKLHLPIYVFLKEPLIRRFGQAWYDELCLTAEQWNKYKNQNNETR